jgi:hypothetical protein
MATFPSNNYNTEYDSRADIAAEQAKREEYERGMGEFFDPAIDEHSEFYTAMELDKHAAHLVAGTSFLDLNTMILKTECNNAYESMNEDDMQRLRKLMWEVYVPHMKQTLESKIPIDRDDMQSFQAQMHVVHISVRVAQALQLIFELNQKKSFSAVAKTAYAVALQDVLYHPHMKRKVSSDQYPKLINFLRRHPTYATPFNTYVGYKLLRQQLVRGGGAGTNRKSNDAERLHDESANRLWSTLDENRNIYNEFFHATNPYHMEWHHLYYKEVADSLFKKLTAATDSGDMDSFQMPDQLDVGHDVPRDDGHGDGHGNGNDDALKIANTQREVQSKKITSNPERDVQPRHSSGPDQGSLDRGPRTNARTASSFIAQGVDMMSAIQDSRDTFAEGISKRVPINIGVSSNTVDVEPTGTHRKYDTGAMSIKVPRHI